MSTEEKQLSGPASLSDAKSVSFTPLGSEESIELTVAQVKNFLTTPTKSGKMPSNADFVKFMMLCKARKLNPWEGDAYLTGYDMDSGPQFNLITAVQALFKRAEMCDEFDGIQAGVCVVKDGQVTEREGALISVGETLVGGWARCHRKDRRIPFYQSVSLSVYDTKYSRWKKDPAGMIQKVAKSAVLREAFPNHLGGMYIREEMDTVDGEVVKRPVAESEVQMVRGPQDLAAALKQRNAKVVTPSKPTKESEEAMHPDKSAILREELLAELEAADTEIAIESIEADINTVQELNDADRKILLKALGAKLAMQS